MSAAEKIAPGTLCVVCEDLATGNHYSVPSCNGCKTFFRRAVVNKRNFSCTGQGQCPVNKGVRCACRRCRFVKCLAVGMDANSIQNDRDRIGYTKRTRHRDENKIKIKKKVDKKQASPLLNVPPSNSSGDGDTPDDRVTDDEDSCCSPSTSEEQHGAKTNERIVLNNALDKLTQLENNFSLLLSRDQGIIPYDSLDEALKAPSRFSLPVDLKLADPIIVPSTDQQKQPFWRSRIIALYIDWAKTFLVFRKLPQSDKIALITNNASSYMIACEAFRTIELSEDQDGDDEHSQNESPQLSGATESSIHLDNYANYKFEVAKTTIGNGHASTLSGMMEMSSSIYPSPIISQPMLAASSAMTSSIYQKSVALTPPTSITTEVPGSVYNTLFGRNSSPVIATTAVPRYQPLVRQTYSTVAIPNLVYQPPATVSQTRPLADAPDLHAASWSSISHVSQPLVMLSAEAAHSNQLTGTSNRSPSVTATTTSSVHSFFDATLIENGRSCPETGVRSIVDVPPSRHYPTIGTLSGLTPVMTAVIDKVMKPFRRLKISTSEFAALQAIMFFDPDTEGLDAATQRNVYAEQKKYISALYACILQNYEEPAAGKRFAAIILRIPIIRKVAAKKNESLQIIDMCKFFNLTNLVRETALGIRTSTNTPHNESLAGSPWQV